ncbi:MAG: alanine racemase [Anaerovoracaceae bacterium]|jgi:D-serine deaminase-like pyridoxal phosphate-dependent protein
MLEQQIETPALVLDLDIFERNLSKAVQICSTAGIALRPHFKTVKCTALAHREIEAGAVGMCCAKVSEARVLVESGIEDVYIANQVTDKSKIALAARLAGQCRLSLCVDSEDVVRELEQAAEFFGSRIYVLVELDVGMNRCGVTTKEAFFDLVTLINSCEHLSFDGIQAYAGHLAHCENQTQRDKESSEAEEQVRELLTFLNEKGVTVDRITGMSTGTLELRAVPGTLYTEAQCGSFAFMDTSYLAVGAGFEPSLSVLTTVMNTYQDHTTFDAGVKSFGMDQRPPAFLEFPDAVIEFSEEHMTIPVPDCQAGQRYHLIPGHCCTTINGYDSLYLVRRGRVMDKIPVDGRGMSV